MLALTNPKYDNKPFDNLLQLSRDGGLTWSDRQLPVGAAAPKDALKWVTGLWADGSGRIVMAISVEGDDQVYTSSDDGRSWQFVKRLAGLDGPRIVQLLSATEWVFVASDASEVQSTADGGGHWRTTVGSSSFKLGSVSFASPDLGWASLMCGGASPVPDHPACDPTGVKRVLLETTDGGRTWTPIGQ